MKKKKQRMLPLPLAICILLSLVLIFSVQIEAIGDKPEPIVGRRDESRASLSVEERTKVEGLLNDFKEVRITASDGIKLQAIVFDPRPDKRDGKNPLIVFVSSWGMNKWEYAVPAHEYAKKGYTVISYTARGFWGSGGQINLAGEKDMADVSTVLDWALAHTNADVNRIGLSGISYGGGMSLLAAAHDKRIRSAASMSCWTDLARSFLGNGESIRKEAARFLQGLAYLTGEVADDLEELFDDYFHNRDLDYLYTFTFNSSAVNYLDKLNENRPAIFIANAFGDSLFTPDQFPDQFYNKLNVPKHMEFAPGDHAGPELAGLLGLPDQVWKRAGDWMDYYVRDAKTDTISSMAPIVFNVFDSSDIEAYNTWDEVTNKFSTFLLDANEALTYTPNQRSLLQPQKSFGRTLAAKSVSDATPIVSISAGDNAGIWGGLAFVTSTIRAVIQQPLHFTLGLLKRKYAAVFVSSAFSSTQRIRGTTKVHLEMIPRTSGNGTLVMYLLDIDSLTGEGKLISFAPWSFKNAVVGQVLSLDAEITMTSYDIPARDSLALVVQTHDPLYLDQSPEKAQIDFLPGSTLSLPLHF